MTKAAEPKLLASDLDSSLASLASNLSVNSPANQVKKWGNQSLSVNLLVVVLFFFFCVPQLYLWGSPLWVKFLRMWPFFNPTIKVATFRLRGWCVLGVFFVAGIHPSRTWTSGSFESVRWNACLHRLDLGLYSHPKEFWGMEFEPMLTPREKAPLPKMSPEEDRTRDAVDSEPKHYQLSYSDPPVVVLIALLCFTFISLSHCVGSCLCMFLNAESDYL